MATNTAINNQIGASNAGATNTLTVTNPDNTNAASNAQTLITTGGAAGGDPFINFAVTGGGTFSLGIDNSQADSLYITDGATLSAGNTLVVLNSGSFSLTTRVVNVTQDRGNVGGDTAHRIENADATGAANSRALLEIITQGATVGDPFIRFGIAATDAFAMGQDNSDSDTLKINVSPGDSSASPSTGTNLWNMTIAGERTMPLQPAFLAYLAAPDANVTGAGTSFTVGSATALTEVFDQGGDFNVNGTFTAPVTGRYYLSGQALMYGCTISAQFTCNFFTSNRTYKNNFYRAASSLDQSVYCNALADMDAADVVTLRINATGEAGDTVDVYGEASLHTYFCGNLVC